MKNSFVTPTDSNAADGPDASTAPHGLIEQLMIIARVSALEEMASGIAHELNQPLGAIATFAQAGERMLSRPEPMTSAALEVMRHINSEAMHAGDGIRRIRKLFNHPSATRRPCSLRELIEELRPVLEPLSSRYGLTLQMDIQEPLPQVAADRLRIQHVVLTLVQNAFEATRPQSTPGRVRIEVTSDKYSVQVAVTDQGTGIPEQERPQIFRPFFTTKREGTGLGLASSRAIIEAHEGTIGFETIEGGGTRFWFRLPALTEG